MTRYQAEILSPWVVSADGQRTIQLSQDYAGLTGSDITGQPAQNVVPDPNLVAVLIECEEAVLGAIEKDNVYPVVWAQELLEEGGDIALRAAVRPEGQDGKERDAIPSNGDFGQIRSFLARNKVSQAQITAVIGTGAQGRSRGEIAEQLRAWMKTLPKGK